MDLMGIVNFLGGLASELTSLAFLVALLTGVFFCISALLGIIAKGNSQHQSGEVGWGNIITKLLVASLLVTFASTLDAFVQLSDGSQPRAALAYVQDAGGAGNAVTKAVWGAIKLWCLLVGVVGFLRGWVLVVTASKGGPDGGDKFWQALWHIVGGSLVVNIFS